MSTPGGCGSQGRRRFRELLPACRAAMISLSLTATCSRGASDMIHRSRSASTLRNSSSRSPSSWRLRSQTLPLWNRSGAQSKERRFTGPWQRHSLVSRSPTTRVMQRPSATPFAISTSSERRNDRVCEPLCTTIRLRAGFCSRATHRESSLQKDCSTSPRRSSACFRPAA